MKKLFSQYRLVVLFAFLSCSQLSAQTVIGITKQYFAFDLFETDNKLIRFKGIDLEAGYEWKISSKLKVGVTANSNVIDRLLGTTYSNGFSKGKYKTAFDYNRVMYNSTYMFKKGKVRDFITFSVGVGNAAITLSDRIIFDDTAEESTPLEGKYARFVIPWNVRFGSETDKTSVFLQLGSFVGNKALKDSMRRPTALSAPNDIFGVFFALGFNVKIK